MKLDRFTLPSIALVIALFFSGCASLRPAGNALMAVGGTACAIGTAGAVYETDAIDYFGDEFHAYTQGDEIIPYAGIAGSGLLLFLLGSLFYAVAPDDDE